MSDAEFREKIYDKNHDRKVVDLRVAVAKCWFGCNRCAVTVHHLGYDDYAQTVPSCRKCNKLEAERRARRLAMGEKLSVEQSSFLLRGERLGLKVGWKARANRDVQEVLQKIEAGDAFRFIENGQDYLAVKLPLLASGG